MASTYSTNLAIELIGTGDQAGSWGNTTNTNLGTLIEQAISGYVTQAVSTGTDTTITIPNGATGVARNMYIELTGTGGASTNLIVPANKKLYFIFNNSTGAVTVKVSGQTGVSVPTGKKVVLTSNGTDVVNGLNYIADFASNSATITNLSATSATITNLTLTSLVISNLSIASANITTLTSASATITNLLGTTLTISGNTFLATSSGNVGIGTASPAYKLDVAESGAPTSTNTFSVARISGSDSVANDLTLLGPNTSQVRIKFGDPESATIGEVGYNHSTNSLRFVTNGAEAGIFDSSGNLGIGTASPGAYRLNVQGGSSSFTYNAANQYAGEFYNSNATGYGLYVQGGGAGSRAALNVLDYAGASILYAGNGNNVGIGTASPATKLTVYGSSGAAYIQVQDAAGVTGKIQARASTNLLEIGTTSNNGLALYTNNTERALLDSSGNLGLGVTPNAWNAVYRAMNIGSRGFIFSRTDNQETSIGVNWYRTTGAAFVYAQNGYATSYTQYDGAHAWYNSTNNTSGADAALTLIQAMTLDTLGNLFVGATGQAFAEKFRMYGNYAVFDDGTYQGLMGRGTQLGTATASDFAIRSTNALAFLTGGATERARITAAGELLVGTTSGGNRLVVSNATDISMSSGAAGQARFEGNGYSFAIAMNADGAALYTNSAARGIIFGTDETERGRFTAGGQFLVGKPTYSDTTVGAALSETGATNSTMAASANATTTHNTYSTGASAYRFYVGMGGTVYATNTTISAISDQRLKENVRDLDVGLDAIMALKPRKFDWKKGKGQDKKDVRGFIAQEFEQVFPDLIDEWKDPAPEGEEPYKSVRQDLIPVLVKAIQELSAKVAALEAK